MATPTRDNAFNPISRQDGYYSLLMAAAKRGSAFRAWPTRAVLMKQIYFTGVQAVLPVALLAMITGTLVISEMTSVLGINTAFTTKVLLWIVIRELGPLLAAIVIIARSSTAIIAELALMRINGEISALYAMGVDPTGYLLVPRLIGVTLCVAILSIYFIATATLGGMLMSALFQAVPVYRLADQFLAMANPWELGYAVLKSTVFGVVIATVACYHGWNVSQSVNAIPQVVTQGVMRSIFLVFLLDALFAYALFRL
ncbi:MAG: ABC transporter permease [Betaproteobacteria bacterium]|nr:ABC transporter permease [Betaproteobacteria bacterium]